MKAIIFSGGVGTRMWPISRTSTPKQFEPLIGDQSTLEIFYNLVTKYFKPQDIFLATNQKYASLVKKKLPQFPPENLILEPARRDLGPAVGYATAILHRLAPTEPVAILWSDDLFKKPKTFYQVLDICNQHLQKDPNKLIYLGQKPLFADQNKGWVHRGRALTHFDGIGLYQARKHHYRPPSAVTKKYFQSGQWAVFTGDSVSTPQFIMDMYQRFAPKMYQKIQKLVKSWGTKTHSQDLQKIYPTLEKISYDDLIFANTTEKDARVIIADMGWYGFGDWAAIKEALQANSKDNVTRGHAFDRNSKDCLVYNYTDQLVTTIDLQGMLVVATKDAILVCPQDSVPEIKKMLKKFQNTELEKYT
jgi:mannose-1-phosphate guanylyltransferase